MLNLRNGSLPYILATPVCFHFSLAATAAAAASVVVSVAAAVVVVVVFFFSSVPLLNPVVLTYFSPLVGESFG